MKFTSKYIKHVAGGQSDCMLTNYYTNIIDDCKLKHVLRYTVVVTRPAYSFSENLLPRGAYTCQPSVT